MNVLVVKKCSRCNESKAIEEFHLDRQKKDGLTACCRSCNSQKSSEWQKKNRKRRNETHRAWSKRNRRKIALQKYGLSEEQYAEMLVRQGGVCAICHHPPVNEPLCVDHHHESGTVRGLLCRRCNSAIGLLDESPSSLKRAADYLG